jgi:membrane protein DedA with SNARE-associated domain
MPEPFASLLEVVVAAVKEHQYLTLFAVIAVEEAGVPLPVPGDLVIAYYGWRAGADVVELAQVVLVCALASTVGTLAPYALARRFGRTVAHRLAGWLDVDPRSVDGLVARVDRYGAWGVFVARLIPGLRVAVSLVAGTARVAPTRFAAGVFAAAALYWTGWVLLGAIVGPRVEDVVSPTYIRVFVVATPIVITLAFVGRLVWARRRAARS